MIYNITYSMSSSFKYVPNTTFRSARFRTRDLAKGPAAFDPRVRPSLGQCSSRSVVTFSEGRLFPSELIEVKRTIPAAQWHSTNRKRCCHYQKWSFVVYRP